MVERRQRPNQKLEDFILSKKNNAPITKEAISLKAAEGEGSTTAVMRPTDEQLEKINQFTRSPKTADQIVVVPTLACNDMRDRDDDLFKTETVKAFATLPEPYSPIGKSFMVGHDYKKLPVGRIFDATSEEIGGATFLKVYSYIPNTDANKDFIDNLEFGVYWAVSVGVQFEAATCPVGKEHGWSWAPWWCEQGHEKGLHYDPNSDEVDDWGYPLPTDDKSAPVCLRHFEGAKDFYELSQVYLGAQYFAELEKDPMKRSLVKAASARPTHVINIRREEAEAIDLPLDVDPRLSKAMRNGTAEVQEDGSVVWEDDGLRYVFEAGEVSCIGSVAKDQQEEEPEEEQEDPPAEEEAETTEEENTDEEEEPVESVQEEEEEEDMGGEKVMAAAKLAGLPPRVLQKAGEITGATPLDSLLKAVAQEIETNRPKAELGERYLKELRKDAVAWYVKARQENPEDRVNTDTFERLLDRCGDDVDLIKELLAEQKQTAQAKFPKSVRRSSFPTDPNEASRPDPNPEIGPPDIDDRSEAVVGKIHR